MSQGDDVLLGRAELERAFTALGERLVRRNVVADVFHCRWCCHGPGIRFRSRDTRCRCHVRAAWSRA